MLRTSYLYGRILGAHCARASLVGGISALECAVATIADGVAVS